MSDKTRKSSLYFTFLAISNPKINLILCSSSLISLKKKKLFMQGRVKVGYAEVTFSQYPAHTISHL